MNLSAIQRKRLQESAAEAKESQDILLLTDLPRNHSMIAASPGSRTGASRYVTRWIQSSLPAHSTSQRGRCWMILLSVAWHTGRRVGA